MSGPVQELKEELNSDVTAEGQLEDLQDVWANAYGCWINPAPFVYEAQRLLDTEETNIAGHTTKQIGLNANTDSQNRKGTTAKEDADLRIYMRPASETKSHLPYYGKDTWSTKHFRNKALYAFSATDPMGIKTSDQKNTIANNELERKIKDLANELNNKIVGTGHQPSDPSTDTKGEQSLALEWWHGIGFMSKTWKEHGFVLMFDNNCLSKHSISSFDIVYKLATEFKQGAVYEYRLVGTNEINNVMPGSGNVAQYITSSDNLSVNTTYVFKRWTRSVCIDVLPEETIMELMSEPENLT